MHVRDISVVAAIGLVSLFTPSSIADDGQEPAPWQKKIAELEAEVAKLKAAQGENWLTERRADEVRALVHDVLADADTRASLLQSGMTGGYDNGFFLASEDGNYRLNINGWLQTRFMYNHVRDDSLDKDRWGFEVARAKLVFTGNVVSPEWIYRVEMNSNVQRGGERGTFGLEDAYIGKVLGDSGWAFLAGQLKVPMLRETLVYSPYQQAVERSLVNQELGAGRTQGIAIDYRDDNIHFTGAFTNGHPATGAFNTPALGYDTEYSLTGRFEWKIGGTWAQFNEIMSPPGNEFATLLGGAIHYQGGEFGTDDPEVNVLQWTVDASMDFGGGNIFAYVVGRHIEDSPLGDLDQYGFVVQGGWFFTEDWEVYGRYEWGDSDISGQSDLSVLTVGVNKYFAGNQAKFTADVGYGFNAVSSTWGDGLLGVGGELAGWRTDVDSDDGQVVIRTQLQLMF